MTDSQSSLASIIDETSSQSSNFLTGVSSFATPDPLECIFKGVEYRKTDNSDRIRRGAKVSRIWDYGNHYSAVSDEDERAWKCALCPRVFMISLKNNNSSNVIRHLDRQHSVNLSKASEIMAVRQQHGTLLHSINVPGFRRYLLAWIVTRQQSFREVEDPYFQAMLLTLNVAVKPYLVESGTTIRNWLEEEFIKAQQQVIQYLGMALSKIHISFDIWSSPNGYALCGVVAHFVDASYTVQHCLLGMPRMQEEHSGEKIAAEVAAVILRYGIEANVGVFVSDNVDTNSVAVRLLVKQLKLEPSWLNRRGRCFGHVINLAAKAFLFGSDTAAFEAIAVLDEDEGLVNSAVLTTAQSEWRKKGPVGKVYNIVTYIRRSIGRR